MSYHTCDKITPNFVRIKQSTLSDTLVNFTIRKDASAPYCDMKICESQSRGVFRIGEIGGNSDFHARFGTRNGHLEMEKGYAIAGQRKK